MREASATDFTVEVDGIGQFRFGRRTMRDELRIGSEFSRLTEGVEIPTPWLEMTAGMISALKVLTVSAPDGWSLDDMDPLDSNTYTRMMKVHSALRAKEDDFRSSKKPGSKTERQGAVEDDPVLVPAEVPASTD